MATLTARKNAPAAVKIDRLGQREPQGDLATLLEVARDELAGGQLENAWTAYQAALEQWVREVWMRHSGKYRSPVLNDPPLMLQKLRSALVLDAWNYQVLKLAMQRPTPIEYRHLDLQAALIESLVKERGRAPRRPLQLG